MRLKIRKAELKQQVRVSLGKYVGMFRHDCRYNKRFIFKFTKSGIFRIPKNQNVPNTTSRASPLKVFPTKLFGRKSKFQEFDFLNQTFLNDITFQMFTIT